LAFLELKLTDLTSKLKKTKAQHPEEFIHSAKTEPKKTKTAVNFVRSSQKTTLFFAKLNQKPS